MSSILLLGNIDFCYKVIAKGKLMVNIRALVISLAILCGASMIFLGWIAAYGWGEDIVNAISSVYIGYSPGFLGGLIGGLWGALDGGIGGLIFGLLYNWFAKKF